MIFWARARADSSGAKLRVGAASGGGVKVEEAGSIARRHKGRGCRGRGRDGLTPKIQRLADALENPAAAERILWIFAGNGCYANKPPLIYLAYHLYSQ